MAALRPAIRSTRVPPIAAVREGAVLPPSRFERLGAAPAIATIRGAVALMLVGLFVGGISIAVGTFAGLLLSEYRPLFGNRAN